MKIKIFFTLALGIFFLGTPFARAEVKDFSNFKKIPVLDSGRLKPLDTFARSLLTQFSGKDHYEKQEACRWLASLFFNPDSTLNDKIFLINDPDIAVALGITPSQDRRYTPNQLKQNYSMLAQLQHQKLPRKIAAWLKMKLCVFLIISIFTLIFRVPLYLPILKAILRSFHLPLKPN
jgi:hypothetical protein